ncbi:MAG: glutamine synthetase III [Lachnospiraceae bacterium]|nr:glutamine synthetase III [Lachnospiraceae bacterium]
MEKMKTNRITDIFGENVFDDASMQEYLPKKIYEKLKKTMDAGEELDPSIADVVAEAMKNWAISKGATHYTHWFQPLTGITAEKHDSFVSEPRNGKVLLEFSGKELIKGEPDASSFPSGGLRATFEARGYTAWDCTSPAFIREGEAGATLCIPTGFCSFTGESLDAKTPLLKSMEAINEQSLRVLRLFGNTTAIRVTPSVGAEQEYFIVDRKKYNERKDLIFAGRTLFGANPPKGQEMDDHYFGNIRERIGGFMKDLNEDLWKYGIPAKTQHNEVAPAQHEFAAIYEPVNIAVDHNHLVMETLRKTAYRHGLKCLLHEKPFDGVNGSGKHDNWSLTTNEGENLLNPGKNPHENKQFLLVLACILKAVDVHAGLLRESAACVGNEHRLGASEAPPAIISVFLGAMLNDIVTQMMETGTATSSMKKEAMKISVPSIPDFMKDVEDRNRTSPFAFTGNKFEFRMVGSSDSIASPNIVLNTIVAEAFCEACDELEGAEDFNKAVDQYTAKLFKEHSRIIFNGNGYTKEWEEEAKKRGLPNYRSMVDAVDCLNSPDSVKMFKKFNVFTEKELSSRAEIKYETYAKQINIEAKTMIDMAGKQFIPAVVGYTSDLADTVNSVKAAGIQPVAQFDLLKKVNDKLTEAQDSFKKLYYDLENVPEKDAKGVAYYYHDKVCPDMENLRKPIDELEMMVDKRVWPVPSYGDMLFNI